MIPKTLYTIIESVKKMSGPRLTFKELQRKIENSEDREDRLYLCFVAFTASLDTCRKEWPGLSRQFFEVYLPELRQKSWYPTPEPFKKTLPVYNNDLLAKHIAGMIIDKVFTPEEEKAAPVPYTHTHVVEVVTSSMTIFINSKTLIRKVNEWCRSL